MQEFADWLRSSRLCDGRSQARLAEDVRKRDEHSFVYQSRLTEWENGKDLPSLRQLVLVALELGLSEVDYQQGLDLWEKAQTGGLPTPGTLDLAHTPSETAVEPLENQSSECFDAP